MSRMSLAAHNPEVLRDVLTGLSQPQKALPGKYLWDEAGSAIFDQICNTEDYYLTRHDVALLRQKVGEVAQLIGPGATIVEFGSGASRKIRILLDALDEPKRYLAIDISQEFLEAATERLARDYPSVDIVPIVGDYTKALTLPLAHSIGPTLGFFPGSTIGNFSSSSVVAFLERARAAVGPNWFLVGADPNHDETSLLRAYAGADGLMAKLHKNLLLHLNRLVGTNFDPEDFRHEARVLSDPTRVEAHLVAHRPVTIRVGDHMFTLAEGESIHTDSSYKLEPEEFRVLAEQADWTMVRCWIDNDGFASLYLLRP
jgi:dimethylhistidine N-methyltransferase